MEPPCYVPKDQALTPTKSALLRPLMCKHEARPMLCPALFRTSNDFGCRSKATRVDQSAVNPAPVDPDGLQYITLIVRPYHAVEPVFFPGQRQPCLGHPPKALERWLIRSVLGKLEAVLGVLDQYV